MPRLTKTLLTKFELGNPDRDNKLLNSYEKSIALSTHQLSSQVETLARYLPMADEARGVLVAVAERLAMVQPIKPVAYLGKVFTVGWKAAVDNWSGVGIPDKAVRWLAEQTPDQSLNFWRALITQVQQTVPNLDISKGHFCRLDVKEDFSDWRLIIVRNLDIITHCYSNGFARDFTFRTSGEDIGRELVQLHFWQVHEHVTNVYVDLSEKTIQYTFRYLDAPANFDVSAEDGYKEVWVRSLRDHQQQTHPLKLFFDKESIQESNPERG